MKEKRHLQIKRFDTPDEIRRSDKNCADIIDFYGTCISRLKYEPGWNWELHMQPRVVSTSCQIRHTVYVLSGCMHVKMEDGTEADLRAGDISITPPGHLSWVCSDESFIAIEFGCQKR